MSNEQYDPIVCILCGDTDDQEALDQATFVHETVCVDCEAEIRAGLVEAGVI